MVARVGGAQCAIRARDGFGFGCGALNREALPYRAGVGVVVFNARAQVLVGRRIDMTEQAWQLPQGGIDPGEDPKTAALRELAEEIGTSHVTILAETEA